ncbi:MAG: laccase domain-containing protein [Clostridium fessum]
MNFSLTRGDNRDDVLENYRKMARILGTDVVKDGAQPSTHTTNIRLVTEADAGKRIWRERD